MKITALIIDDEEYCIDSLKAKLTNHTNEIQLLDSVSKPEYMLSAITKYDPQVIFLDINLGPFTGFDLIEKLIPPLPKIVFTTAYDQYAIKAFKYNAIDYLLKPINADDLAKTIQKLKSTESSWPDIQQMEQTILKLKTKTSRFQKLALPTLHGFELIDIDDLIRLEAASNYTHFYMKDSKKITISKTLKEYEELLDTEGFTRIHQSHMVNMRYIKNMVKGKTATITLHDGTVLDIGATRRDSFMERFKVFYKVG